MTLLEEFFCSLQDAIFSCDFCQFQSLLFVKRVFAPKLVNVTLELKQEITGTLEIQKSWTEHILVQQTKKQPQGLFWGSQSHMYLTSGKSAQTLLCAFRRRPIFSGPPLISIPVYKWTDGLQLMVVSGFMQKMCSIMLYCSSPDSYQYQQNCLWIHMTKRETQADVTAG